MINKRLFLAITYLLTSLALQAPAQATPEALSVLSAEDEAAYRQVFDLQKSGKWKSADKLIKTIDDPVLMGYVKLQRYMHPTAYKSRYTELKSWMAYYADHPEASRIYALALKRRPRRASTPQRPIPRKWRNPPQKKLHPDLEKDYARTSRPRLTQIEGRVRFLARKNQALKALKEIERHVRARRITTRQFDRMKSWIAASLYYQGYVAKAKSLSNEVADRNGDSAVLSYWISGLIAFREGDMTAAAAHFTQMASVPYQEDTLRAGAGFWAARANLSTGNLDGITKNLEIAADFPFTFYGQLALAQLGRDHQFNWQAPNVREDGLKKLKEATPAIQRAIALKQVGKSQEADLELRWANGAIENDLDYDLLAVASALDLPAAQIDIALSGNADYLTSGLYPVPSYAPHSGFETDRALIYALMRQESKFKTDATSRVGARGLMQLMPRTASFVAKDRKLRTRSGRKRLYDPGYNLQLGQTYVNHLINTSARGDLFDMAVAYNGGPGNLRRWKKAMQIEDPLLFIESIPNTESRDFVEKVLTNFWIYRARLGQTAPSRDRVAAGELPLYEALDQAIQSDGTAP